MYRKNKYEITTLKVNNSYEGETIEQKVQRIVSNKEPIKDGAPLIYTERKQGVQADYNIRTDKWEHAIDAMDYVTRATIAKRNAKADLGKEANEGMEKEKMTEGQGPANTNDQAPKS